MNIDILDEHDNVLQTIVGDVLFAEENFPGMWRIAEDQPGAPVAAVPQKVTARQAHQALILAGLYDAVQTAISAIADPLQRKLAQVEWEKSQEFARDWPLLLSIGQGLGLTDADMDDLFIQAGSL
jgi:hypothetical protein